eukprot:gene12285-25838_t
MVEKRVLSMKAMNVENSSADDLSSLDVRQRVRMVTINRSPPPRTTIAAIVLLLGGVIFLSVGCSIFVQTSGTDQDRGIAVIVLGCLMFIPGSYASTVLYGSWAGWEGYEYNMVPSYDE